MDRCDWEHREAWRRRRERLPAEALVCIVSFLVKPDAVPTPRKPLQFLLRRLAIRLIRPRVVAAGRVQHIWLMYQHAIDAHALNLLGPPEYSLGAKRIRLLAGSCGWVVLVVIVALLAAIVVLRRPIPGRRIESVRPERGEACSLRPDWRARAAT